MKARLFDRRKFLAALGSAAALASRQRAFGWEDPAPGAGQTSPAAPDIAHDPLRPACHLLPPHNWMNDPNGPIGWKGKYHLFYQLNPHAAVWGDMHWGHAVSPDMIHWHHEPIALPPPPAEPTAKAASVGRRLSTTASQPLSTPGFKTPRLTR